MAHRNASNIGFSDTNLNFNFPGIDPITLFETSALSVKEPSAKILNAFYVYNFVYGTFSCQ